tara:strand:+ start:120 stop:473 length:354 start_codon:yes stop_codon:yes gene_type:complete
MSELENSKSVVKPEAQDNASCSESDSENSSLNSEYTEVNLQEDRLYQVLSTFFENEEGDNLSTILSNINENIQVQNKILNHIAETFSNMQMKFSDNDQSDNESDQNSVASKNDEENN